VSLNPGIELVVEAFEGYWRRSPSIKRIVFRSLPDETTRAAALKGGYVDLAMLLTGPVALDIRRTPGIQLTAALLGIFWLDFPDQWDPTSPWADRRVRMAANLAIDRQAFNEAETIGLSRPPVILSRAISSSHCRSIHRRLTRLAPNSSWLRPGTQTVSMAVS
jgi:peptide/nickel transport system substrate-binding protein